jgi:hypothetical protein
MVISLKNRCFVTTDDYTGPNFTMMPMVFGYDQFLLINYLCEHFQTFLFEKDLASQCSFGRKQSAGFALRSTMIQLSDIKIL